MPNCYPRDGIFNQHLTSIKDFYIPVSFRAFAGQDAYEMAAEKPEILQVLNNPPEVHIFEISSSESSQENLQRAESIDNCVGMFSVYLVLFFFFVCFTFYM